MPLIICPDCKNQVSDIAPTCPHCGRPTGSQSIKKPVKRILPKIVIIFLIFILASILFYFQYEIKNKQKIEEMNQQQKDFVGQQYHQQHEQKMIEQESKKQTEELQKKQKELEEQQRIKEEETQQHQKELMEQQYRQQIQQSQQNQELSKTKAQYAIDNLAKEMINTAMTEAKPRHQASNITNCSTGDNITINIGSNTESSALYKCHMVGGILGVHSFDVGVRIRYQIIFSNSDYSYSILGAYVEYDNRQ